MFRARNLFISIQYVFHSLKLESSAQSVSQRNIGSQNCDKNKIRVKTLRGWKLSLFSQIGPQRPIFLEIGQSFIGHSSRNFRS